jgi:type I restriction enzyme R subunit
VTRLFADPEWDGPIEQDDEFRHVQHKEPGDDPVVPPVPPVEPKHKYVVDSRGCKVTVSQRMVSVYDTDGKLLRQESIIDYTKANIYGTFSSLDNFILQWSAEEKKAKIQELFNEHGIDLEQIKADEDMSDVDDFDFICHIAFGQKPLTRRERAENVKKRNIFAKYGGEARAVLEALLEKYADSGIYEIEDMDILKLDPFIKFGKPAKIASLFGGREGYIRAVRELEQEIYKAA